MWGEKMKERRGLFEAIFGKKQPQSLNGYSEYKLLNSYQSNFIPFSGNAWEVNTVRAAIHSFARRAARVQPRHIRKGDGKLQDVEGSNLNYILQYQPNPLTTAYKFYYRVAAQYKLYNNAFIFPVWNEYTGKLEAMYNINAQEIKLLEHKGELFLKFRFYNGKTYTFPYTDIIHIGSMFADNELFGSNNEALMPVLKTANTFNQSMSKFAELVAVVRGILKVAASTKNEDLNSRRDDFIRDNLKMENNGAGVIVTDNKYDYTPIQDKQTPLPQGQLLYIKTEIYDYLGTNEAIVQNKATPEEEDDFYDGEIKPFYMQLEQAFTNCFFTRKERGFGNLVVAEGNKLQYAKLSDKLAAVKYLSEIGGLMLDQALVTLGFPPIGGEEGKRRVQTLNMVNADKADEYQLGDKGKENTPPEDNTDDGENSSAPTASKKGEKNGEEDE
jgi:HK97 family phage portal protein